MNDRVNVGPTDGPRKLIDNQYTEGERKKRKVRKKEKYRKKYRKKRKVQKKRKVCLPVFIMRSLTIVSPRADLRNINS